MANLAALANMNPAMAQRFLMARQQQQQQQGGTGASTPSGTAPSTPLLQAALAAVRAGTPVNPFTRHPISLRS
jgi:hypothetical protein